VATWRAPTDNGGSAINGYKVERLKSGNWDLVDTVSALEISIPKETAGSIVELRVSAVNEIGESAKTSIRSNFPYVQSEPVADLKAVVSGSSVIVSWSPPKFSGGAPVTTYLVERTANNGSTWTLLSYVRTGTTFSTSAPAKGQSYKFRVYASTLFGKGVVSETDLISTALTVSGAPAVSSGGFAVDGTYNLNWRKPSDNGGTEITGYVVEKLVAGVWSKLAEVGPTVLTLNMSRDLPGATVAVRVLATNAVGTSAPSSQWTYQIPALRASAPRDVAVSVSGSTAVRISWLAPESLGGSTLSRYEVQASRDGGSTWISYYASATSLSLILTGPGKGLTWQYRVLAYTSGAGLSEPSTVVSFTKPLTTSSTVSYLNGYKSTNAVVLNFRAPTDLGGYPTVTYIVQKQVAGAWVSEVPILQLDGTTMTRHLVLPPKGITYYQVIAVNGSGQSAPVVVRISY
jgi:titin